MSFGASRMYRGLADYLTFHGPSTKKTSNKEQSRSSSTKLWFASQQNERHPTECTYDPEVTVPASDTFKLQPPNLP